MIKGWIVVSCFMFAQCVIGDWIYACETKTVYLPDGSIQICQVCKDAVICY